MDIEARFKKISDNSTASLSEYDDFYSYIISTPSQDLLLLNEYVRKLKAVCLDRAIDHSKYRYRERPVEAQTDKSLKSEAKPDVRSHAAPKTSTDVRKIIEVCRKRTPFLSFGMLRLNNADPRVVEKFLVLYSGPIDEDWIRNEFVPDSCKKIEEFKCGDLDSTHSWVLLCIFYSSNPAMRSRILDLIRPNTEIRILDLSDLDKGEDEECWWKRDREKLFAWTLSNKPSVLIHGLLNVEQECLIKGFFGSNINCLVYSELRGGFSGALVVLVAPNVSRGDERKYVIKICEKSKSKLKQEMDNYNNYVAPYYVSEQPHPADYNESPRYEALRYPFASKDTISLSTSFTNKYKQSSDIDELQLIIDNIFNHTLCKRWRKEGEKSRLTESRSTAIKIFEKIIKMPEAETALSLLLSPYFSQDTDLDKDRLKEVLECEGTYSVCLNHGDLHSDNIQIQNDSNEVFLIDFGMTGSYPAGLDYAALEASIRFKLLDYSADLRLLSLRDSDPLGKFDNVWGSGKTCEGDIDKAELICSKIRERFLNDFEFVGDISRLKNQYLFCLLALCLRQTQYPQLNRRYILQFLSQILSPLDDHVKSKN